MKFASILSVLALAITALATSEKCPKFNATELVTKYIDILEHKPSLKAANASAQALLVDDYSETSDSILALSGLPLDTPAFKGKSFYIEGIVDAPAYTDIETFLIVPACGYITWHWAYNAIGSKKYRVKGFHLFQVTDAGQLKSARLEFNSVAWGADSGYVTLFPGQNCTTDPTDAQSPLRKRWPAFVG